MKKPINPSYKIRIKKLIIEYSSLDELIKIINDYDLYPNIKNLNNIDKNIIIDRLNNCEILSKYRIRGYLFKNIFKSTSILSLNYWVERGFDVEESKNKISLQQSNNSNKYDGIRNPHERMVKKILKNGGDENDIKKALKLKSHYTIDFWMNKGFDRDESIFKIKELQKNNSLKFIEKYNENPKKYEMSFCSKTLYWINKGFSENEAQEILSTKFVNSLDIYINKYGEELGFKKWLDKNEKWRGKNNKTYNPLIYNDYIKFTNIDDFVCNFVENSVFLGVNEYHSISKIKLLQHYFSLTEEEIYLKFIITIKNKYHYNKKTKKWTIYFNNHICRSFGELEIATFLYNNNIEYKYEKFYPNNNNKKCDFYINKLELYVEYLGMLNYENKDNSEYIKNIELKNKICLENNLKYYFSKNVKDVIEYIHEGIKMYN